MKKLFLIALLGMGTLSFQACNNQQASNDTQDSLDSLNEQTIVETSDTGSDFLTEAASGGMMEVELGKIAQQNASNARVKDFGSMMVNDHSAANDELKQLTMTKNVSLPNAPLQPQQSKIDDLKNKTGNEFDKDYMSMMVDDHQKDIDKFEDAAENSNDPDVKAFANKILPKLRMHLDTAKEINESLKD